MRIRGNIASKGNTDFRLDLFSPATPFSNDVPYQWVRHTFVRTVNYVDPRSGLSFLIE